METKRRNNKNNRRTNIKREVPACYFTQAGTKPNYKDVLILKRFITDRGKIVHHAKSGVSSKNQRLLTKAIKQARYMALLPYTDKHAM